jgi:hypothetical protein
MLGVLGPILTDTFVYLFKLVDQQIAIELVRVTKCIHLDQNLIALFNYLSANCAWMCRVIVRCKGPEYIF